MQKKTTKKPFFLLDDVERIDDDLLNCLLGIAVHKAHTPLAADHRPGPPYSLKARDAISSLYAPEPTYCRDVRLALSTTKSRRARAQLQKLIQAAFEHGTSDEVVLEAAELRRFSMRNAPTEIAKLLDKHPNVIPAAATATVAAPPAAAEAVKQPPKGVLGGMAQGFWRSIGLAGDDPTEEEVEVNPETEQANREATRTQYRDEVIQLLQRHHSLGIITSFITCTDMSKTANQEKRRNAELDIGTGTSETTGTPVEANVGVGYHSARDVAARGTYEGEYLIACSYLPLELKPAKGGLFNRSKEPEYELGKEEVWRLGDDPIEGDFAAPLGGGEAETGGDGDDDANEDTLPFVLLHPDDKLGENTGENESDSDDTEEDSEGDEED